MKYFYFFSFIFILNCSFSQSIISCDPLKLTLDDLERDMDFSGGGNECGFGYPASTTKRNCKLVAMKMVKTENGVQVPKFVPAITFWWPLASNNIPDYPFKNYVELYALDPIFTRIPYNGNMPHQVSINNPAPPGEYMMILVCPGSEAGPMRGRFAPADPIVCMTNCREISNFGDHQNKKVWTKKKKFSPS